MPLGEKTLDLNIWDESPMAYCVVEVVLDEKKQPMDWIYRYCNQAFADLKQYRLESLIDQPFSSLSPRKNEGWLRAYYQAAFENRPYEMELDLEGGYHASFMPTGHRGFCACAIYTTEFHNSETDAAKSMENEKQILNRLSPEYASIYHIEANSGKYEILRLCANTNARKIVEKHPQVYATYDEYAQHYAETFILPEDREEFTRWMFCAGMKEKLSGSDKINYHYHSVSETGEDSYYEAYAVKGIVDESRFDIFLGFRNIDSILFKEKQIQMELQNALDRVRLSNEIISAIARTYQYISRIDLTTDHYEEISNKDPESLDYGKSGTVSKGNEATCRRIIAEEYQEVFLKFTDLATLAERMGKEESIALEYQMKDGSWHKLRFIEKKRDEEGNLTNVLCVIRSTSESKKREQDLLYQVAEARQETALKSRFLSNMSHDIRTPLNGIMGMIEVANNYPEDLEVQKKCREQIMKSSQYLVSVVGDILAMSKLEVGDSVRRDILFDLAELLGRVNTEKQKQAQEKNISYLVDWEKGDIRHQYLMGNQVYLERLLAAIADNAVKFTDPDGYVRVWCREISADDSQVVYEFGCSDSGIGMSEEFLPHAFEMFAQEKQSSRSQYEGTGLGLAIAQRLAERMGGSIRIESTKGEGTTVVTTIPFRMGHPGEMEKTLLSESENQTESSLEGLRALLVEDNELNTEVARFLLEKHGMLVECAEDGEEAVRMFEESSPGYYDVIFMDIMMPGINGWDTARMIRSMRRKDAGEIPIIAMSANNFADDIINSRISGMNLHLAKPLEEDRLLQAIYRCLRNKESGRTVFDERKADGKKEQVK